MARSHCRCVSRRLLIGLRAPNFTMLKSAVECSIRSDARGITARCSLGDGGAADAACPATQPQGRSSATVGSRLPARDHLRAQDRHPMGIPAPRVGLRVRDDLLAAAARLAGRRGLVEDPPSAAEAVEYRRQDRLGARGTGWLVHPSAKGGLKTGPNPTDRGKAGTKHHLIVDRRGTPLAALIGPANEHDSRRFEDLLDAVPPLLGPRGGHPRHRPTKIHADKGYDFARCRAAARQRGILPRIARRGIESRERLGRHRWVVERTFAWLHRFRRLRIRYERNPDIHLAFLTLGCALICWKALC